MQIGSYEIVSKLGEGSFGRTFLGKHMLLGHKVVLKQEKTADPQFMKLFEEEARMLQGILHHGFPTLLDYFNTADFGQVMALSYVEGITGDKLKPVADEHMCWIVDRILQNLAYLHSHKKIIHCDLKPENIIVNIDDHLVSIIDLGVSMGGVKAYSKAKGGTHGFMPPEFELGLPPVTSSDIYSVAKIAIAITGGDIMAGEPPTDMKPELKAILKQMLVRDPRQRPIDANELRGSFAGVRRKIWGRSATVEAIKYR